MIKGRRTMKTQRQCVKREAGNAAALGHAGKPEHESLLKQTDTVRVSVDTCLVEAHVLFVLQLRDGQRLQVEQLRRRRVLLGQDQVPERDREDDLCEEKGKSTRRSG